MSNFCTDCGARLGQNARFCGTCGARIADPDPTQTQAAASQRVPTQAPAPQPVPTQAPAPQPVPTQAPAPQPVQPRPAPPPALPPRRPPAPAKARIGGSLGSSSLPRTASHTVAAPTQAGEITFGVDTPQGAAEVLQVADPARVLVSGARDFVRGVGSVFKDKKRWIPALLLAALWFVLSLLPILDMDSEAVQALSWLTFARGGMGPHGEPGLLEMAGGVLGKGVVAGLLFSILSSGTLGSMGAGLKTLFSSLADIGSGGIVALLCGAGVALTAYNFMAGAAVSSMSMAGIAAFLLSLRTLGSKAGFLRAFLGGLTARKTGSGKMIDTTAANRVMAGMAMGFALSVPLSALDLPTFHLPYLLGGLLLISGAVLGLRQRIGKKEATI